MRLILQPDDWSCGQTCVAMAAEVTREDVVRFTGEVPLHSTAEMVEALRFFGIKCADRLRPIRDSLPQRLNLGRAVLHTQQRVGVPNAHWTLLWDGGVFDPAGPHTIIHYPTSAVSYLEIYR